LIAALGLGTKVLLDLRHLVLGRGKDRVSLTIGGATRAALVPLDDPPAVVLDLVVGVKLRRLGDAIGKLGREVVGVVPPTLAECAIRI
jgi:hypothetical protein